MEMLSCPYFLSVYDMSCLVSQPVLRRTRPSEHDLCKWCQKPIVFQTAAVLLQDVRRAVLPVLAKLLSEDNVREHVPHVLAELLKENTELQATAADADAVPKLALILQQENCSLRLKV